MTKVDMAREAVRELGEAPAEAVAAFIDARYGVKIDPRFIPVLKASVRERELLEDLRRKRAPTAGDAAGGPASPV